MIPDYPVENIFGKMRGRYDEIAARSVVKGLVQDTLDKLWSLSDDDLVALIEMHKARNKSGSHRLEMRMRG